MQAVCKEFLTLSGQPLDSSFEIHFSLEISLSLHAKINHITTFLNTVLSEAMKSIYLGQLKKVGTRTFNKFRKTFQKLLLVIHIIH